MSIRFSYQNLDDGSVRRFWSHGRAWIRRGSNWYHSRLGSVRIEWNIPSGHCGWSVSIGDGDSGGDLGVTFAIPFVFTLYVTFERVSLKPIFQYDFDRGQNRTIGCYFHDWGFWYHVWVGSMASWSRRFPWCRWWRQGHFDFRRLLGRQSYKCETLREHVPVQIPMPEGVYHGLALTERQTWKRTLWFRHERVSTSITVKHGIPFAGKGENSWDCGDDGLFSCGVEGDSIEKAIGHYVYSVLSSRRRHGHASPKSVREALLAGKAEQESQS